MSKPGVNRTMACLVMALVPWLVPGRAEALKVTTPFDLIVAEALLGGALA